MLQAGVLVQIDGSHSMPGSSGCCTACSSNSQSPANCNERSMTIHHTSAQLRPVPTAGCTLKSSLSGTCRENPAPTVRRTSESPPEGRYRENPAPTVRRTSESPAEGRYRENPLPTVRCASESPSEGDVSGGHEPSKSSGPCVLDEPTRLASDPAVPGRNSARTPAQNHHLGKEDATTPPRALCSKSYGSVPPRPGPQATTPPTGRQRKSRGRR